MARVYNFSAGPSMLPEEVLKTAAAEMLEYGETGQSVMEMSHRSAEFKQILKDAEADLRDLMSIPDNYKVLFLQGGGTLQFSMVPLNLMTGSKKADYIVGGSWAKKAAKEAAKFGDVKVVATSEDDNFTYIPKVDKSQIRPDLPNTKGKPMVADVSSCFLSEPVDITKYALMYGGVQKNIGPAGMTLVIVREDLLGKAPADIPIYLDYQIHADNDSSYNTPPCFAIYVAGEVFKKIKREGGVEVLLKANVEKAKMLYDYIDGSGFYKCPVAKEDRSLMNVVFVTGNGDLDKKFVSQAKEKGLHNLGGHRSIGGMRASIYNAMPKEGVEALIDFMEEFRKENA